MVRIARGDEQTVGLRMRLSIQTSVLIVQRSLQCKLSDLRSP